MPRSTVIFKKKVVEPPPLLVSGRMINNPESLFRPGKIVPMTGDAQVGESSKIESRQNKRHAIYDKLAGMGLSKMGVGEENRGLVHNMLEDYAKLVTVNLREELRLALRTNAERNKARKEKNKRKMEAKQTRKLELPLPAPPS